MKMKPDMGIIVICLVIIGIATLLVMLAMSDANIKNRFPVGTLVQHKLNKEQGIVIRSAIGGIMVRFADNKVGVKDLITCSPIELDKVPQPAEKE